jgi:16S rRNA C1402 (ribose-2'-O) methylase RsmI
MPIGDDLDEVSASVRRALLEARELFVEPEPFFLRRLQEAGLVTDRHRVRSAAERAVGPVVADLVDRRVDFAVFSASGIPAFVDPGRYILAECLANWLEEVELVPVGMSSALDGALAMCGLDVDRFVFAGHYPENYALDRRITGSGIPIVAYVNGRAVGTWLRLVGSSRPLRRRRHILFKDLATKLERCRVIVVTADTHLADDPRANYVAVLAGRARRWPW